MSRLLVTTVLKSVKAFVGFFVLVAFVFAVSHVSYAFDHKDLKGVMQWLKPEFEAHVPILDGYTLLETEGLRNRRFFGNYGPKQAAFGCMELVRPYRDGFVTPEGNRVPGLIERNDCPQDATSEMIQRLFPSVDGQILAENGAKLDLVSHLKPRIIGKLLERIAKEGQSDLSDSKEADQLEADLTEILFEVEDPENIARLVEENKRQKSLAILQAIKDQKNALSKELHSCIKEGKDEIQKGLLTAQIETLKAQIGEMTDALKTRTLSPVSGESPKSKPKLRWDLKDFKLLSKMIVDALKGSRSKDSRYPKNLPEQVLMAFFLKKFNHKAELLELFAGMRDLVSRPEILTDPHLREGFLKDQWVPTDRKKIPTGAKEAAQFFIENPESFIFEMKERSLSTSPVPPVLSFKTNVPHPSIVGGHGDCGETQIRYLIGLAIWNPGNSGEDGKAQGFDIKRFEELKKEHPELHFSKNLIEFFRRNSDPSHAGHDEVHKEWNELVASSLPGVKYRQGSPEPVCDMDAGVDNMLKVMDQLLFSRPKGEEGKESPLSKAKTRAEKMDTLFSFLSRKDAQIHWSIKGKHIEGALASAQLLNEKNLGVDLEIRRGQTSDQAQRSSPLVELGLTAGHFSITDLSGSNDPWKSKVLSELLSHPIQASQLSYFLPWLIDSGSVIKLPKELQNEANFYVLPLRSASDQISGFKAITAHPKATEMKSLALGIKKKLGSTDYGTIKELSIAESEANYPFGDPPHALNKPDVKVVKVAKVAKVAKKSHDVGQDLASDETHIHVDVAELKNDEGEKSAHSNGGSKNCLHESRRKV